MVRTMIRNTSFDYRNCTRDFHHSDCLGQIVYTTSDCLQHKEKRF
ncbi:hypothetical protein [Lactococcus garvieae]